MREVRGTATLIICQPSSPGALAHRRKVRKTNQDGTSTRPIGQCLAKQARHRLPTAPHERSILFGAVSERSLAQSHVEKPTTSTASPKVKQVLDGVRKLSSDHIHFCDNKIKGRTVNARLYHYLEQNACLDESQSGYWKRMTWV
ncbi:hypothetical protein PoB_005173600 [Plakobranchus ocellatus]|uniref:Uncharacterized protein n=1 Tax=Plakobranchus ocellatus TaxID=259542 RepID=A0AAV4C1I4_9GAST|nr:hypothetical protein PoB_005173600 [Plakobranchus ocellatus]